MAEATPDSAVASVLAASRAATAADRRALEQDVEDTISDQDDERRRFLNAVQPLVERATRESSGNDRLRFQYRRLTDGFAQAGGQSRADADSRPRPPVPPRDGDLRAYVRLGPRTSDEAGAHESRRAMARALGESGAAAEALRQLFEGGPDQLIAAKLTGDPLDDLLDAAVEAGFSPPTAWLSQPPTAPRWNRPDLHDPTSR